MSKYCTEVGTVHLIKYGEELCGDHAEVIPQGEDSTVIVCADGLGSGVKANILSTLTAKMLSTMMAEDLTVEDCVTTMIETLPVCQEREVAYSTFTIVRIIDNLKAEIIQYDNPHVIMLRRGKNFDYPKVSEMIEDKLIYKSKVNLEEDDTFIIMSDGVLHASEGPNLDFSWDRDAIIEFMEAAYDPSYTAKALSTILTNVCNTKYGGKPGDDTSVCTVKIRKRRVTNLIFGPPVDKEDDEKMMDLFFSKKGDHVVCGGVTAKLAARFLNKEIETEGIVSDDPEVPPISKIEGVDLTTEGAVTMSKVLEYAKDYVGKNKEYDLWSRHNRENGAAQIAKLLFEEATDINFYVGKALNPATHKKNLPHELHIKVQIIEQLKDCLEEMGKKVRVSYF